MEFVLLHRTTLCLLCGLTNKVGKLSSEALDFGPISVWVGRIYPINSSKISLGTRSAKYTENHSQGNFSGMYWLCGWWLAMGWDWPGWSWEITIIITLRRQTTQWCNIAKQAIAMKFSPTSFGTPHSCIMQQETANQVRVLTWSRVTIGHLLPGAQWTAFPTILKWSGRTTLIKHASSRCILILSHESLRGQKGCAWAVHMRIAPNAVHHHPYCKSQDHHSHKIWWLSDSCQPRVCEWWPFCVECATFLRWTTSHSHH